MSDELQAGAEPRVRFTVHAALAGYRLDHFLQRMIPKLSRNRVQKAIATRVRISWDAPVKPSTPVREGGIVSIEDAKITEETIAFDPPVLYEDEGILAIDKPPGIVVHPTHSHLRNTVITLLRQQRGEDNLTLAHRLDAETSGILLLGRHRWAARKLQTAFEKGRVDKHYLALVFGHPEEDSFRCELPLGPFSRDKFIYRQSPEADETRECETRFRVLSRGARFSLIEAELLTGRRHQIRAHLACCGFPVVGDKLYALDNRDYRRFLHGGGLDEDHREKLVAERCLLHCKKMVVPHLRTPAQRIEISCSLPADMRSLFDADSREII